MTDQKPPPKLEVKQPGKDVRISETGSRVKAKAPPAKKAASKRVAAKKTAR